MGPEKFTILDSDVLDSEVNYDEWITVSTSNTVSTTSTLPSHLNLNPKSAPKGKCTRMPKTRDPEKTSPSPPPPQYTDTTYAAEQVPASNTSRSTQTSDHISPEPEELIPTALLKSYLHNLTAIYIVSRTSITDLHSPYVSHNSYHPFTRLSKFGLSPVSTSATRSTSNSIGILRETYIRVCADCAKPRITIYCDGTWTSPSISIDDRTCTSHTAVLQNTVGSDFSDVRKDTVARKQACEKCRRYERDVLGRCVDCDLERDRMLFRAVLEAVDPFRREETKAEGVTVFDMSVPVAGEVYKHVDGCNCKKRGA